VVEVVGLEVVGPVVTECPVVVVRLVEDVAGLLVADTDGSAVSVVVVAPGEGLCGVVSSGRDEGEVEATTVVSEGPSTAGRPSGCRPQPTDTQPTESRNGTTHSRARIRLKVRTPGHPYPRWTTGIIQSQ